MKTTASSLRLAPKKTFTFMPSAMDRKAVIDELNILLGSSYILLLKTHGYHWNVTGPLFKPLHDLFEAQYLDLFAAADEIAERIRALGEAAPFSFENMKPLSVVQESKSAPSANMMIAQLLADHEKMATHCRKAIESAQEAGDEPSADLAIKRAQMHEKHAWMLRSSLE